MLKGAIPLNQQPQTVRDHYGFPARMLTLSLALTLFLVVWMGGNSFYIHYFLTHNIARDQKIAEISDEVLYLDSVITLSARASTGDSEFDRRYIDAIEEELHKAADKLPEKDLRDAVSTTEEANEKILSLDRQYLSLIESNKISDAERVIHSTDYSNYNKLHLDGRSKLTEKVRQASNQNLLNLENNIYTALLLVAFVTLVIFSTWYSAIRSVRRWRQEMEASRARETQAKIEAQVANAALILSEQAAKQSAIEAQKANDAKSEFLTNMSHELRTPMHAILGFSRQAQTLPEVQENKPLITMLDNIRISGKRLMVLLNNLLDLSKLESGKSSMDFQREDICKAIKQTLLEIDSLVKAKNIQIAIHNVDVPSILWYDYKSMVQVFMNLLSNAIKFSSQDSEIAITLSETKTSSSDPALLCAVRDYGIGIPPGECEVIFDKFIQSSKTRSGAGGTGLGLPIVRQIIQAHKGEVWAENAPGGGAVFKIRLPYTLNETERAAIE